MRRRNSSDSQSDAEREKEKRRIAWMIQQQKEREHERLKRKKIEEYERKRAEQLGLKQNRQSSPRRPSASRSRSRSEESHHRSRFKSKTTASQVMSEKLNFSKGNTPLFKGPDEAPKIDTEELRKVVVNIYRKIPGSSTETTEIRRSIVNHEEITLKRREGEGMKPIFDRDELKHPEAKTVEIEERRTILVVDKNNSDKKSYVKRRSISLSPPRQRSPNREKHSSSRSYSHRSRHEEYSPHRYSKNHHSKDCKSERRYSVARDDNREDTRYRHRSRGRSHSRERDYHKSERGYSRSRSEKDYEDRRGRSKDRSYDRRDGRDRPREEHHIPSSQYIEQVPYPMFYGGFRPRPMLVGPPIPPIRGPMGRGRLPIAPIRPPFPPRFVNPQDMFRNLPDPRFGRMF